MDSLTLANAAFDAAEARDFNRFLSYFAPDATIWSNFSNSEQPALAAAAKLMALSKMFIALKYEHRCYTELPDGAVLQHVSRGVLPDGRELVVPMMMRLYARDGLIRRIEEYFDTQAASALLKG